MVVTPIGIAVGIGVTVLAVHVLALYYVLGRESGEQDVRAGGE